MEANARGDGERGEASAGVAIEVCLLAPLSCLLLLLGNLKWWGEGTLYIIVVL